MGDFEADSLKSLKDYLHTLEQINKNTRGPSSSLLELETQTCNICAHVSQA